MLKSPIIYPYTSEYSCSQAENKIYFMLHLRIRQLQLS